VTEKDYYAALAMYASADQRSTANMIELIAATVLRKLVDPKGEAVASVSLSPDDLEATARSHYFEARYQGDTMTILMTEITSVDNRRDSADMSRVTSEEVTRTDAQE